MDIKFGQQLFSFLDINSDNIIDSHDLDTSNQTNKLILQELGISENSETKYSFEQLQNSVDNLLTDNPNIENMLSEVRAKSQAIQATGQRPSMELELATIYDNIAIQGNNSSDNYRKDVDNILSDIFSKNVSFKLDYDGNNGCLEVTDKNYSYAYYHANDSLYLDKQQIASILSHVGVNQLDMSSVETIVVDNGKVFINGNEANGNSPVNIIESSLSSAQEAAKTVAQTTNNTLTGGEAETVYQDTAPVNDCIQEDSFQYVIDPERKSSAENPASGVTGLNGEIDNTFEQGQTGDCWLLGSIQAIAQNEKGKQILNDSIKILDNGNVEVTLKGVNKTYTFTQQEIMGRNELSSGDLDVRALEMAVQKYIEENPNEMHSWNDQFEGNTGHTAFKILVGGSNKYNGLGVIFSNTTKWNITDKTIDNFNEPGNIAVTSSSSKSNYAFVDGNGTQQELIGRHTYAIKGSDEQNVYLVNPHDTSKIITVPREEYKKFFKFVEKCKI